MQTMRFFVVQEDCESRDVPVISRVQVHPRCSTHSGGVPADRGASCGQPLGQGGATKETGCMTRGQAGRAGSSVDLPLTPSVPSPTQLPHSRCQKQSKQPSNPSLVSHPQPPSLSLATSSNHHDSRMVHRHTCQPCSLIHPLSLPQRPGQLSNREDGEGRGAKDAAGVHPRRLRRPRLGPRCRSWYGIPRVFAALHTHSALLLEARPSLASRDAVYQGPEIQQQQPLRDRRPLLLAPCRRFCARNPESPLHSLCPTTYIHNESKEN